MSRSAGAVVNDACKRYNGVMLSETAPRTARASSLVLAASILLTICIGAVLRLFSAQDPVWLDELHTAWCVSGSLGDVWSRATQGNQSPIFYWLVYPFYQVLGETKWALRSVSLMASLLVLPSLGYVMWRWTRSALAVAAMIALAAVDDTLLFFAAEARPYALVQLAFVWQLYFLVSAIQTQPPAVKTPALPQPQLKLIISSVLLFYLHYSTVLVLLMQVAVISCHALITAMSKSPQAKTPRGIIWMRSSAIIAVACLPGLGHLLSIAALRTNWSSVVSPADYWYGWLANWIVYLVLPMTLVILARRQQMRVTWKWEWTLLFSCSVLVPLFALASSLVELAPLAIDRFTIASVTATIMLTGIILAAELSGVAKSIIVSVVVLLAAGTNPVLVESIQMRGYPQQRSENWEFVARQINRDRRPVFIFPNLVEDRRFGSNDDFYGDARAAEYYLFPLSGLYEINREQRMVRGYPIYQWPGFAAPVWDHITLQRGGWLIIRGWNRDRDEICELIRQQASDRQLQVTFDAVTGPPLHLIRLELNENEQNQ